MTRERRLIVTPSDIKGVTFECAQPGCGARVTFVPSAEIRIPVVCPNNHQWGGYTAQGTPGPALKLAQMIAALSSEQAAGFRVFLEVEEPEA